jgi:hypothetical protein
MRNRLIENCTWCYIATVTRFDGDAARAFKTAWFSKAAEKVRIKDAELFDAVLQAMKGQADNLGGGVFKKRLNKNRHRAIILARGRRSWFYIYLFAKKDRSNIRDDELAAFRDLADIYSQKSEDDVERELKAAELQEIRHEETQI